ncbi:MAG: phosphoribosylamine--glycine ligase [Treponema sp.]|nr:phosphoribosylamine--glycine ligase [Treponema sp.]MCL2236637.1 phosphoribosylamine--glycine ligase [Treponema sp.]
MKVLVVGGGGREHAIIKALKKSTRITRLYGSPGNGGIMKETQCGSVKATDISAICDFVVECEINYIVVGPDDPLSLGLVDALEKRGRKCFGPNKAAARIESSKVFSKNLMKKYGIPTAAFYTFSDYNEACAHVKLMSAKFPMVIKADGLALGKGVIIAQNCDEALAALNLMMVEKKFGESGSNIVIEEFLTGPEVTVMAFTDGKTIKPMISSMDHKRAFDGNKGPNTGGMGVIAPNPHYTKEIAEVCEKTIFTPTVNALKSEGCPFKGCLYFGLMLTPAGPKVIEYNCRFGDPEAQAVLPLLETDLFDIFEAVTDERLSDIDIKWKNDYSACVVLASGGYPDSYKTGFLINGLDENGSLFNSEAVIYHAGTAYDFFKKGFVTSGGRVMGVSAVAPSLSIAVNKAYTAAQTVNFDGIQFRKDIGNY